MKKDVTEVFKQIDIAIISSVKDDPTPINKSIFLRKYREIKKKFLK